MLPNNDEVQELETPEQDDLEIQETPEAEADAQAEPEAESKKPDTVPLHVLDKQREQKRKAEAETEKLRRENEALQQERDLLMLGAQPKQEAVLEVPHPDDYLDNAEYTVALNKYLTAHKESVLKDSHEEVAKQIQAAQQQQAQTKAQREAEAKAAEARERYLSNAQGLNAEDFLEADDRLRQSLDPNFYNTLIKKYSDTPELAYEIGSDQGKIDELINDFASYGNPWEGMAAVIGKLDERVKALKPKTSDTIEPDEPITGGAGGVSGFDQQLERKRNLVADGKLTMQEFMAWKKANNRGKVA